MSACLWFVGVIVACGIALAGLPNALGALGLLCLRGSRALRYLHRDIEQSIDREVNRLLTL